MSSTTEELTQWDDEAVAALLVGHRVTKVDSDRLVLDDGTILTFEGNSGCGGRASGWYELTALNDVDNIITAVTFSYDDVNEDDVWSNACYRIFVVAENKQVNLATFEGTDGNGYYGSGYRIYVRRPQ